MNQLLGFETTYATYLLGSGLIYLQQKVTRIPTIQFMFTYTKHKRLKFHSDEIYKSPRNIVCVLVFEFVREHKMKFIVSACTHFVN